MEHDHIVIDGGLWRGTGFEDTDGHCLASFTFVPLEQILKHCICDPLHGVGDYERLVLYNQCCCPLSVSVSNAQNFSGNFGESAELGHEISGKFLAGNACCIRKHVAGTT
ncbi:hypothetical protein T4D_8697 [Trichinella pseudospiralis]|uniref:Uncharacterized protein n=1 Tax=Trichinella pseudospiralis TaxID=6337 RepID=A0A0V1FX80_TRIPS|nr:hypothetical protein T4D_8697 [Trichinella pseudospiralis]